jgi:hypothetical protein
MSAERLRRVNELLHHVVSTVRGSIEGYALGELNVVMVVIAHVLLVGEALRQRDSPRLWL